MSKYNYENLSKEELIEEIKKLKSRKKYGLVWEDHPEDINENAFPMLEEVENRRIVEGGEDNLLIEGDNYHSLRSLLYTHKSKIDVIYIDPPYNTGNKDFVYNDKMIGDDDIYRHSKWLSFMEKRLRLARELMSDDSVIFISIDDNELAQLKLLCDSIFSESKHIGTIIHSKGNAQNDADSLQKNHEYILVYKKENGKLFNKTEKYIVVNRDDSGYWYKGSGLTTGGAGGTLNARPNLGYTIYYNELTKDKIAIRDYEIEDARNTDATENIYNDDECLISNGYIPIRPPKKGNKLGRWTWSIEKFNKEKEKIGVNKTKNGYSLFQKKYVNEVFKREDKYIFKELKSSPSRSILDFSTSQGTKVMTDIFGEKVFDNPKNTELIKYLLSLHPSSNSRVLDFFAGSGTTGHAVLELNKQDGGNRKFILCTNNENNISEKVTYERIKRVINGYTTPKGKDIEGLPGNLRYYKTIEVGDIENPTRIDIDQVINHLETLLKIKHGTYRNIEVDKELNIYDNEEELLVYLKNIYETNRVIEELKNVKKEKHIYIISHDEETMEKIKEKLKSELNDLYFHQIPKEFIKFFKNIEQNKK